MADGMADGGDIEAKIVERVVEGVLQDPEVLARVKSLEDLQGLAREMPEIMRELERRAGRATFPADTPEAGQDEHRALARPRRDVRLERHTTVQARLLSAVDRHLAEAEAFPSIPPERALVVVVPAWPVRTWPGQIRRALTRR